MAVQWQQIAQQEGVIFKPVSLPKLKFVETVAEPVRAFAILVFKGKTLYFRPDQCTIVEVSYRAPYFKITTYREGSPHLESMWTPDASKVTELLRKYPAYLAE